MTPLAVIETGTTVRRSIWPCSICSRNDWCHPNGQDQLPQDTNYTGQSRCRKWQLWWSKWITYCKLQILPLLQARTALADALYGRCTADEVLRHLKPNYSIPGSDRTYTNTDSVKQGLHSPIFNVPVRCSEGVYHILINYMGGCSKREYCIHKVKLNGTAPFWNLAESELVDGNNLWHNMT